MTKEYQYIWNWKDIGEKGHYSDEIGTIFSGGVGVYYLPYPSTSIRHWYFECTRSNNAHISIDKLRTIMGHPVDMSVYFSDYKKNNDKEFWQLDGLIYPSGAVFHRNVKNILVKKKIVTVIKTAMLDSFHVNIGPKWCHMAK